MASKFNIPSYAKRGTQNTCKPEDRNAGGQRSARDESFRSHEANSHHPAVQRILDFREKSQRELYPVRGFGDIGYGPNDKLAKEGGIPGARVSGFHNTTDSAGYTPTYFIGHPGVPPVPNRKAGKPAVPPVSGTRSRTTGE